jgi:hypothetical protein
MDNEDVHLPCVYCWVKPRILGGKSHTLRSKLCKCMDCCFLVLLLIMTLFCWKNASKSMGYFILTSGHRSAHCFLSGRASKCPLFSLSFLCHSLWHALFFSCPLGMFFIAYTLLAHEYFWRENHNTLEYF